MSYLRDYQEDAKYAAVSELSGQAQSTLVVLPTGTGKTEVALDLADTWPQGDVLFLAHRQELVYQPAERWQRKTGEVADIVMAERRKSSKGLRFTSGSIQTLQNLERLREAFPDPRRVGLVIVDEAHHAAIKKNKKSYGAILDYLDHRDLRILGITATPDRSDEQALGQTFDSVAYEYPLYDPNGGPSAIADGWLVPIRREVVQVDTLDFAGITIDAEGDFDESDLERRLCDERVLQRITAPTIEIAGDRQTLVFAAGINQAIEMAVVFDKHRDASAMAIASRIPDQYQIAKHLIINSGNKEHRRLALQAYGNREYQFLCNMAVLVEGWDEPWVQMISGARPTKSRALAAQMAGRGTRVLPNVIESRPPGEFWRLPSAAARKAAIAASLKPNLIVLEFVGNESHSLISIVDILGGSYTDEVVARAKASKSGRDVVEALIESQREFSELQKRKVLATANYKRQVVDAFAAVDLCETREPGWHAGRTPTENQLRALRNLKVEPLVIQQLTFWKASQLIGKLMDRIDNGQCTYRQSRILNRHGFNTNVSVEQASAIIDRIRDSGWVLRGDSSAKVG